MNQNMKDYFEKIVSDKTDQIKDGPNLVLKVDPDILSQSTMNIGDNRPIQSYPA